MDCLTTFISQTQYTNIEGVAPCERRQAAKSSPCAVHTSFLHAGAGVTSEVIKLVAAKQSLKKFKANDEGHYPIISLSLLA
jgi:hypothetical protein